MGMKNFTPEIKRDKEKDNQKLLFDAIKTNKWTAIQDLIYKVDNVEARDAQGNTFINVASQCGNFHTVRLLAHDKLANVNTQNKVGNTPLHYAIAYKYNSIMQMLIDTFNADETIKNQWRLTPWEGIGDLV